MVRALNSILPRVAAAITIAIALSALAGWTFGVTALKSVFPHEAPVEANTALGLILAGGALWRLPRSSPTVRRDTQVIAAAVLLLGLVTLAQYVFDLDFAIDELFFQDTSDVPGGIPGRMSPYSAVAFAGIGLALSVFNAPSLRPLVWAAAALTAFVGAVPIAGYVSEASAVIGNRWLSPLAASIAFVLLGLGTIAASLRNGNGDGAQRAVVRSSVERKVIAAFAGALVLLAIGAGFTYRASVDFAESAQEISHSEQLRDALDDLYVVLTGAESAQTAYLLTARQQQREEYQRLAAAARGYLRTIAGYTAGDRDQTADMAELKAQVERRLQLLDEAVSAYDENGLASAREAVASAEGAQNMRAILRATTHMNDRGESVLLQRESTLARTRQLTLGSLLLTLAVAAGIFLTLFRGISGEMAARAEAERSLRERNREILALNSELAQRAGEVEAVNRELEAFSYSVSHDLRAPLRHIDGYLEMLVDQEGEALSEAARRHLEVIAESSRDMSRLIDDLLAFSRMARTELHMERVELEPLVREVIESLEMGTRGREIEWRIAPLPSVRGDFSMLRQVFANLLGNAVKYTEPRDAASIEVGCAGVEEGRQVFFVRDNGVGFDMQHAGKLFGLFQRLHRADEFEGTGIGLANVRRIVARHGGTVWTEAEPGRGATFYFSLEAAPP
jgi:signal transduction histidine kinase